jgi:hypothetical protein
MILNNKYKINIFCSFLASILIFTFNSCRVAYNNIAFETKNENVTIGVILKVNSIGAKVYREGGETWLRQVCSKNNIEIISELPDDSLCYMKFSIPNFESARRLVTNINNQLIREGEKELILFDFIKTDSTFLIKVKLKPSSFVKGGGFVFLCNGVEMIASPERSNNYIDVSFVSGKGVMYKFKPTALNLQNDSTQVFSFYYPNSNYVHKNKQNDNKIALLFEEHLWATISAILGSIVSLLTIIGFLKNKR